MEYLYQQQPKPTDAKGVTVYITAIDPNGNWQDIGNVTSDIDGNFAVMWTPPVSGLYKITATFAGSNSYYGSHAVSNLGVSEAPASSPNMTPTPTPTATPTVTPTSSATITPSVAPTGTSGNGIGTEYYIAIAAAVIIILVVAIAVVLRRRK